MNKTLAVELQDLREEIAKELEANYIGATYTTWEDGFDDGMKKAIEIVRKAK